MYRVRRFLICGLLCVVLAGVMSCGGGSTTTTPSNPSNVAVTISTLTLSPATLNGGETSTATVTLNEAAPVGGVTVVLSTSNNSVTLPVTLTLLIPQGQMSGTFKVQTLPVGSNQTAQISVTYLTFTTLDATLTILSQNPLSVTAFTVNQTNATSGQTLVGTVTLNSPAFSPGQQVFITSSDISVVQPTNPVTVQTKATTASFSIFTSPLTATRTVNVSASLNATTVIVALTLTPAGTAVTSLNIVPFTVAGGQNMTGTVTVTPPAPPGGESIQLTAAFTNPATPVGTPLPVTVPASVSVPAGATQAQFTITSSAVTKTTDVTVTATLNTTQYLFTVEIVPSLSLAGINCLRPSVTSGNSVTCDVQLSLPAPAGGQAVQLTSSNPTALPVPATLTIPAGTASQTFTLVGGPVSNSTQITLTASLSGSGTTTGSVTTNISVVAISALIPTSFTVSAGTVQGGASGNLTGTVTIAAEAPPGGIDLTFTSSDPSVQVPSTVTVPQNQTGVTFPITTSVVTSSVKVTLMVTVNGFSLPATLTVVPAPALLSLTINPTSVVGSGTTTGTVTLQSAAPQNGAVVVVQSSSNLAQAAPAVTVPPGSTSANFAITTLPLPLPTSPPVTVTITASLGGAMQQAMLTILPPTADVRQMFFNPSTIRTGQNTTGTVVLTAAAGAGGTAVALGSALDNLSVPAQVVVPQGATSATFVATATGTITSATQVVVTASVMAAVSNTVNIIAAQTATLSEQLVTTGATNANNFPLTTAFQGTPPPAGSYTGFLTSVTQTTAVGMTTSSATAFSTYLGGTSSSADVRDVFIDTNGNVFVCGSTLDGSLQTKNPFQGTIGGGRDAFVAEFNKTGAIQFLTYFGGAGDETCNGIVVDTSGNIYISGSTSNAASMGLAGTSGAFQTANNGGNDFFLAKFNPNGSTPSSRLLWCTLVGGANDDFADGRMSISPIGAVYITGKTSSVSSTPAPVGFPIPPTQARPTLTGVGTAGVVTSFTPDGAVQVTSTLLFGKTNGANPGTPTTTTASGGLAFDASGSVYVCGQTNASDLPVTANAFQPTLKGTQNAYVAVLSSTGVIEEMTYLGGTSASGVQACKGIAVDSDLNPIVVMPTDASDFPVRTTLGPAAAGQTHFVAVKFSPDLSNQVFSTLLGGSGAETADATHIQLDTPENIYFTLSTTSGDFPVTSNALFKTFNGTPLGANRNAVIIKMTADGAALNYASFLGGAGDNSTTSIFYHPN